MDKGYSNSIQSLTLEELKLVFEILTEKNVSKKMRDALVFRYDTGFSISFTARRFEVDRIALSNAENRVVDVMRKILAYIEKKCLDTRESE